MIADELAKLEKHSNQHAAKDVDSGIQLSTTQTQDRGSIPSNRLAHLVVTVVVTETAKRIQSSNNGMLYSRRLQV